MSRLELGFILFVGALVFSIFGYEPFQFVPISGDSAFHLQSLYRSLEAGFGNLRFWDPMTGLGEVRFLNYFPLPFLIAKFLSLVMSPESAWMVVTLVPPVLIPSECARLARKLDLNIFSQFLAGLVGIIWMFAPEANYFGANLRGQLFGMVGHGWSILFLLMLLAQEWGPGKPNLPKSVLLSVAIILSHVYGAIALPFLVLLQLVSCKVSKVRIFMILCLSLGLTSFFWLPFLLSLEFSFPVGARTALYTLFQDDILPVRYLLILLTATVCFLATVVRIGFRPAQEVMRLGQLGKVALLGIGPLLVLSLLQISWVRAYPLCSLMILLSLVAMVGQWLGTLRVSRFGLAATLSVPVLLASNFLGQSVPELKSLATQLFASREDSRFLALGQLAAILRVGDEVLRTEGANQTRYTKGSPAELLFNWHTLPLRSQVPIASTLHVESNHTNPLWLHLRSLIGTGSVCFPSDSLCGPHGDLLDVPFVMDELGIGQLIVGREAGNNILKGAQKDLFEAKDWDQWVVLRLKKVPRLVKIIPSESVQYETGKFRDAVQHMHNQYRLDLRNNTSGKNILWASEEAGNLSRLERNELNSCNPEVSYKTNAIELTTDCPWSIHKIKFAFRPELRAQNGAALFMLSPGLIGIVPGASSVMIELNPPIFWAIGAGISIMSAVVFAVVLIGNFALFLPLLTERNIPRKSM